MPRTKGAVEPRSAVVCGAPDCKVEFVPRRSTAKYHSATCQKRAARSRRAAAAASVVDEKAEAGDAEHGLVRATRLELTKADAVETVDGQIALQLARKLTDPDHVSPGLAKELRASLAAAKGVGPKSEPVGDEPSSSEDELPDELKKARAARDAAREAAGQA